MAKIAAGNKAAKRKPVNKSEKPAKKDKAEAFSNAYDLAAKITVLIKENPRKKGSELYRLFDVMTKCKTVGDFYERGGRAGIIRKCVAQKWIQLS